MQKPLVIYHANCADGFSAAWCFHRHHPDGYDFHPGVYNKPPPDVTGRTVYLVDFSYKRNVVEEMIKVASQVTLIDHHQSAMGDLKGLPGLAQFVSLEHSGATLAWNFLFGNNGDTPPLLLGHIEDRDLWRFRLPNKEAISASVFSYEYTFENWDRLMSSDANELLNLTVAGAAITRKHHKDIKELLKLCKREMTISGYVVPVASLPYTLSSDAGNLMSVGEPFAACYVDTKSRRIFSLRSQKEGGIDVARIAEQFGGGGHKNASGFSVPRDHYLAQC